MFTAEPAVRAAFLTDEAGNIMAWNKGCEVLFGLRVEQIFGQPMSALLVGTDREPWPDRWGELVTQARAGALEVSLRGAHGRTISAFLTLAREYDRNGDLVCCVAAVSTGLDASATESEQVANMPLGTMVDLFPGTFYAISRERRFVLWNHNLELLQEMSADEIAAANPLDFFDLVERARIAEKMREVFDEGAEVTLEADVISKSGREIPMMLCGARIACCGTDYLFGVGIDITERRQQEEKLRLRERALHAASNGIVITRCEGRDNLIEYVNPAFERISGYRADEVIGRDPRFMAAPGLDPSERNLVRTAIAQRHPVKVVFRNQRKNGELFWNDLSITPVQADGKVTHFIGVIVDVTASKQRTAHLEHEVNHDALTGLANRNLLWDRLEQALHLAQRNKSMVATVLIDLNNFKTINDSFGHEAGDVVLKVVARRLQASVRDSDTVARLSGDEFVLVLVNQPSLRYTVRMIERVRAGLSTPVSFNRQEIALSASIGVAIYPHDGATVADLIRAADVAMYHAKATGKDGVYFYSSDMKSTTEAKQKLEAGMHEALRHDQLFLMYQPRVDLRTGRVCGFEALLRWQHPEQGVMLPPAFLSEAEENGCIVQIGNRVLDQACAFLGHLRQGGFNELSISVNLSYREYSQHGFIAGIAARLDRHALPANSLEIELRGDDLLRDMGLGRDVANQLQALGLPLSVDDFGEGLSHLNYLQQLSARRIKMAKGTVHAIGNDGPGSAIAKTVIDIGHNLNMSVIAEAVETRGQLDFLRAHGCDQMQGSCFSGPLRAEAAEQMVRERHLA